MIKKFLQKVFKTVSYGIFLKIHGKIEKSIDCSQDKRIKVKIINKDNNLRYRVFNIINGRLYTDRIHDTAVLLDNKIIEEKEEIARNVNWKLKSFEFDNLFNYGEDNVINFDRLNGIVGIFGKNFSGKSSIIDAALYTLFNTTSKNERKNLNVINQNRDLGRGKLTIEANNATYTIQRDSTKYVKRLKGVETLEAKTD